MIDKIISQKRTIRPRANPWGDYHLGYEAGELLTMANGEEWFHPYCGAQPRLEHSPCNS